MATALSLTACSPEVDKVFDEDGSARIEAFNKNLTETLTSAPNGWRMEYYASTTYGGYNVLCKFTDSSVTVASEQVSSTHKAGFGTDGKLLTCTSHYRVDQSQGSILSFDGYNEIFHYFSDPKNDSYGTYGTGMAGDLEFRVHSVSADSIVMVGKKHGNTIKMYPIPSTQSWEDVINEVDNTDSYMDSKSYTFVSGRTSKEISVMKSYRRLVFNYQDDNGETQQVVAPYIPTADGYKFYETYEVDSVPITGFYKGSTDEYFLAMNNSNARLETYMPPFVETLQTGMWFIGYDYLGAYAQPSWLDMMDKLATSGPNDSRERLYWALIGTYQNKVAIHLQFGNNYAYYGLRFTSTNDEGDEVKITLNGSVRNNNGRTYYNKYGLKEALEPFVGTTGRTFKITSDSQRHPSYLTLTDVNEPTNVITLYEDQITYVFGDRDKEE